MEQNKEMTHPTKKLEEKNGMDKGEVVPNSDGRK